MSAAIGGFIVVLVVAIAADFRVLNALICLFKSIRGQNKGPQTKGTNK